MRQNFKILFRSKYTNIQVITEGLDRFTFQYLNILIHNNSYRNRKMYQLAEVMP